MQPLEGQHHSGGTAHIWSSMDVGAARVWEIHLTSLSWIILYCQVRTKWITIIILSLYLQWSSRPFMGSLPTFLTHPPPPSLASSLGYTGLLLSSPVHPRLRSSSCQLVGLVFSQIFEGCLLWNPCFIIISLETLPNDSIWPSNIIHHSLPRYSLKFLIVACITVQT